MRRLCHQYNEDEQLLEKLDNQIIEENTISVELEHFSTYIVLNQKEFDEVWDNEIVYYSEDDVVKPIKIAFALDCSGSMYSNDPGYLRRTVSNLIIDKMTDEDLGAVILFSDSTSVIQGMTSDTNLLKNAINATYSSGMTALYYSLNASINQFDNESADDYKNIIILLSDGYDTEGGYTVNNIATMARAKNIKIFTIGLGNGIDVDTLSAIATQTGGKYYHATVASELEGIYTQIGGETVDAKKDSNHDGISDYYTKLLCEGKIRTGTGIPIFDNFLSKNTDNTIQVGCTYEKFQKSSDLDGDGLKNGEEIQIVESEYGVYAKKISDPCEKDSDYDTYSDYKEVKIYNTDPLRKNVNIDSDDILFLADNSEFYSSIYSEEYSDLLSSKKISAWIGNKVYGSSFDNIFIMEEVLLEYLLYTNDCKKEEYIRTSVLDDINQYMSQVGPSVKRIANKSIEITGVSSYNVEMLQNKYFNLQDKYFQIIENGSTSELKTFMSQDAKEVLDQYYIVENELNAANIKNQKLDAKWEMPNFTKAASFEKAVDVVGFTINLSDIVNDYYKGQSEFMTIRNNIDQLYSDIYILENIENNTKDNDLYCACENLINKFTTTFHEDYGKIAGTLENAFDNFIDSTFSFYKYLPSIYNIDFEIINISLGISNAITGYSEVSKEAVKVYVMGMIPRIMYEELTNYNFEHSLPYINHQIKFYDIIYYDKLSINPAYIGYNNLITSRIFAEMRMIKLQKSGAKWLNKLYDLLGSSRKEIISDCEYMIQQVESLKIIR